MKKKIIAILMLCIMMFTLISCVDYNEANTEKRVGYGSGYFTTIKSWNDTNHFYEIVYANDTKVMYFVDSSGNGGGITPLYNADGTLQIYNGK